MTQLGQGARDMSLRFALQHIDYWRKASGPMTRQYNRQMALWHLRVYRTGRL